MGRKQTNGKIITQTVTLVIVMIIIINIIITERNVCKNYKNKTEVVMLKFNIDFSSGKRINSNEGYLMLLFLQSQAILGWP